MTRKDFISKVWKKGVIPIALFLTLLFAAKFLYLAISNQGPERFFSIVLLVFIILFALSALIGEFASELNRKIQDIIPRKFIAAFKLIKPYLKIILLVATVWLAYKLWTKDWVSFLIVLSIIIVDKLISRPNKN